MAEGTPNIDCLPIIESLLHFSTPIRLPIFSDFSKGVQKSPPCPELGLGVSQMAPRLGGCHLRMSLDKDQHFRRQENERRCGDPC